MEVVKETKKAKPDEYQELRDELEARYGPELAQQIVDEIRKVESPDFKPGYVGAKVVSEAMELFRCEARGTLRKLKEKKKKAETVIGANVIDLETGRLQVEFRRLYHLYFLAQKGYYNLFWRNMFSYGMKVPLSKKFKKTRHEQEIADRNKRRPVSIDLEKWQASRTYRS